MQNNELYYTVACYAEGIDKEAISSKSRKGEIAQARHRIINLLRDEGLKLVEIGELINRDHTTVMHSLKKHQDYMFIDKVYSRQYNNLQEKYKKKLEYMKESGIFATKINENQLTKSEKKTIENLNQQMKERGLIVAVF